MLDGRRVVFLIPLPRYIFAGCCDLEDHAPNRSDPRFLNPGLCVPSADTDGDPLWSDDDPVHPLYNGYESIIDTIMKEADSLRPGGKRPGDDINPAAKKPRTEVARPRWIEQPTGSVMHGGQQWFRPGNFGRGRSWGSRRGFRGGRRNRLYQHHR